MFCKFKQKKTIKNLARRQFNWNCVNWMNWLLCLFFSYLFVEISTKSKKNQMTIFWKRRRKNDGFFLLYYLFLIVCVFCDYIISISLVFVWQMVVSTIYHCSSFRVNIFVINMHSTSFTYTIYIHMAYFVRVYVMYTTTMLLILLIIMLRQYVNDIFISILCAL